MQNQRLPSLDGVIVSAYPHDESIILLRAAERCKSAAKAARAIRAAGVPGRIETDAEGVLTMRGEDWDRVEWEDARSKRGFISAEHWTTIPEGEEGAGDSLRALQLRWPVLSRPGTFMPTDLFELSNVFMAGWRVCSLAAASIASIGEGNHALDACQTVLAGTIGEDHQFEFATPWSPALLGVTHEPDEEPEGHDAELVSMVASRAPPCVEVRIMGGGDHDKVIVTPRMANAGSFAERRPSIAETMRAVAIVQELPILRDAVVSRRRMKVMPKS